LDALKSMVNNLNNLLEIPSNQCLKVASLYEDFVPSELQPQTTRDPESWMDEKTRQMYTNPNPNSNPNSNPNPNPNPNP